MKEKTQTRAELIKTTKSVRGIIRSLRKAEAWLFIAAIAAFLASSFFVVKYFVGGDLTPSSWDGEQWANACLGLGLTAVITAAQALLYASGYKGPAAIIATIIVVFFGLFSEISQSMEREDATVKHRSENSKVFQAALAGVSQLSAPQAIASPYAAQLAEAEARLSDCKAKVIEGVYKNCDKSQGRVDSLRTQNTEAMKAGTQAASTALPAAIAQAKALEYDEDKHYAMIRFIKEVIGVTGIWASFLFSLIIIGTFEYAFHFVGAYVADHRQALLELGLDPDELTHKKPENSGFSLRLPFSKPLFVSRDTESAPQDTAETQQKPEIQAPQTELVPSAVLVAVNNELRAHRINRIQKGKGTEKTPGQLFNFLRDKFGGSNGDVERLTSSVIDALATEKIIIPNAQKQGRANAPDYVINYKHSLFLLNADGTPRKDVPQLHAVT